MKQKSESICDYFINYDSYIGMYSAFGNYVIVFDIQDGYYKEAYIKCTQCNQLVHCISLYSDKLKQEIQYSEILDDPKGALTIEKSISKKVKEIVV